MTSEQTGVRAAIGRIMDSKFITNLILVVIAINAVTLGLETTAWGQDGGSGDGLLRILDIAALSFFVVELSLKIFAKGRAFFSDAWNVFDFLVVGIALLPGTGPFQVMRGLRVLRVLRVVHVFPRMKFIIESLLRSLPGIAAIAGLLAIVFYVSAVMSTELFGERFPEFFGSIWRSLFSLFQVMSLEGWPDLVRVVMDVYPLAWLFFIPFILFTAFTILNLFIGIIVDTMQTVHQEARDNEVAASLADDLPLPAMAAGQDEILAELSQLRTELAQLRQELRER